MDLNDILNKAKDNVIRNLKDFSLECFKKNMIFNIIDFNAALENAIKTIEDNNWKIVCTMVKGSDRLKQQMNDWYFNIGKTEYGNNFIDLKNLTDSDKEYLKKLFTFFEEENPSDIQRKWNIYEDWVDPKKDRFMNPIGMLFNVRTGELQHPKRYKYLGKGMVKNLKTGVIYDGLIFKK